MGMAQTLIRPRNGIGMIPRLWTMGNRALQMPTTRCAAVYAECAAGCLLRMATARSV